MRSINKPIIDVKDVFVDCISIVKDPILKKNLADCLITLQNAEVEFDLKIRSNEIYTIPQLLNISPSIGKREMKKVYTDRMAKKGVAGRVHYDKLLASATGGKCPLCSQRIVSTLDHYLPKSKYPIYAVTPLNLIPSCSDCNKGKQHDYPKKSEEETLHPYFDSIENDSCLSMRLLHTDPIIFEYYVNPPVGWPKVLQDRIVFHFDSFNLNTLYSVHAAEEFQNIKKHLLKLFIQGGTILLKEHLTDCLESRDDIYVNSWQTAFYRGLVQDDWFCTVGINQ